MRSALKEFIEALPEPFNMVDIEARVKEKSPYVVVALQEVGRGQEGAAEDEHGGLREQTAPTPHPLPTAALWWPQHCIQRPPDTQSTMRPLPNLQNTPCPAPAQPLTPPRSFLCRRAA